MSAWQIALEIYNDNKGYAQPVVTSDATFAAYCTQDTSVCPIAIGGPAVTAIENACSSLGLSCESFSSFEAWIESPNYGFVNCNGSDAYDSYSLGQSAATEASDADY